MKSALMLAATLISTFASGAALDPIETAIQHYVKVESYSVIIQSVKQEKEEKLRYYFKRPGFVRIEFIHPYGGAVLIFSPLTQRVRLWPFGQERFPELSLNPNNPLILSSSGQRVDHSDVGSLLENVRVLAEGGKTKVLDISEEMNTSHIIVTGLENKAVGRVHRFDLWIDKTSQFPTKIISRDLNGDILETVNMDALELNPPFPESLFQP